MKSTLTIEIPWEHVRSFEGRHLKTVEGPKLDVINLAKAQLNLNNIVVTGNKVEFESTLLGEDWEEKLNSDSIIYFRSVNKKGADGYVKNIDNEKEEMTVYFFDCQPYKGLGNFGIKNGEITIPMFGLELDPLLNLLEESGVIQRISVHAFFVTNKESFYRLHGEKQATIDDFIDWFKNK